MNTVLDELHDSIHYLGHVFAVERTFQGVSQTVWQWAVTKQYKWAVWQGNREAIYATEADACASLEQFYLNKHLDSWWKMEMNDFNEWREHIRAMETVDVQAWAQRLRDEIRAFHLNEQLVQGKFCVIQKDREWLAERFKTMTHGNSDRADANRAMLNLIDMELGVRVGWWEDFNEAGPIDFPKTFRMDQFGEKPLMAHVVHALGIFPSVTQARKNGFDTPLTIGDHVFTKKKIRARVINAA